MNVKEDKTLKWVFMLMIVFFSGFGLLARTGDIILTAMYPLYIGIFIGLLNTIKYRFTMIDQIETHLLKKELKLGYIGTLVGVVICIYLSLFNVLAVGFIIPFYLLTISGAINAYLTWAYLNDKSNIILSITLKRPR